MYEEQEARELVEEFNLMKFKNIEVVEMGFGQVGNSYDNGTFLKFNFIDKNNRDKCFMIGGVDVRERNPFFQFAIYNDKQSKKLIETGFDELHDLYNTLVEMYENSPEEVDESIKDIYEFVENYFDGVVNFANDLVEMAKEEYKNVQKIKNSGKTIREVKKDIENYRRKQFEKIENYISEH